ncbi:MmcQ/YjbR family DNA-binding protein [Heliobacterium gestii]|uniref:MmcQ/YjbR family DNA-binding protein n=1 Tax=Heliomicrobium gestii TaxID=2699 RepID=A0A845LHY4_HELGE|nr:MmcQ/YjbR family DNA-binding protein [Heliomicrobium gestii]MBM7868495.1 putative DNA-binding protein (MmcQ/YjbR family) [Heliomicrobium gestii]MZP44640.1 MmcQ/YjbR family DNA-binding protein [Heliomicrobium gestii]
MKYSWLDQYCLNKKGAEKDFQVEWNATRYMIRGKMFALQGCNKENKPIITVKLDPMYGDFLRRQYKDIVPGYYMNKTHWNSLSLDGDVPDDVVKDMLDKSHELIFNSLSKKVQKEISNG